MEPTYLQHELLSGARREQTDNETRQNHAEWRREGRDENGDQIIHI